MFPDLPGGHLEQPVSFHTTDRLRLAGVVSRPETTGRFPLVVLCHGIFSGKNNLTNRQFVVPLLEKGIATLRFDFRGHYDSEGSLDSFCFTDGIADLDAAMAWVRRQDWVEQDRVGVLGASFGGTVAVLWAGGGGSVRLLALKSPTTDYVAVRELGLGPEGMKAWKQTGLTMVDRWLTRYKSLLDAKSHDVWAAAAKITVPCLIAHGAEDMVVPVSQSIRLAAVMGGEPHLVLVPGADHLYTDPAAMQTLVDTMLSFVYERL